MKSNDRFGGEDLNVAILSVVGGAIGNCLTILIMSLVKIAGGIKLTKKV